VTGDLVRFVVRLPGGDVTLLPRRAPLGNSGPIRGRSLTIVAVLDAAPDVVLAQVPTTSERFEASILPGDRPALALADLSEADAISLGRALALDEIFYWDGRRGRLVAV
jgi:hypothetical protein